MHWRPGWARGWRPRPPISPGGSARCWPPPTRRRWRIPDRPPAAQADAVADIGAQLDRLLPKGFVTVAGATRLADLTRYLLAIGRRLERLPHAPGADRERMDAGARRGGRL